MKSPLDLAHGLLGKARNDIIAANAIIDTGLAFDAVCFHAQQAVEKSLKAILAAQDLDYPYRHDLGELLAKAAPVAPSLSPISSDIINLTPYAIAVRYDQDFDPSEKQAWLALQTAETVFGIAAEFVERH